MAINANAPFVIWETDTSGSGLTAAELLLAGSGIALSNSGSQCTISLATSNVSSLFALNGAVTTGLIALTGSNTLTQRSVVGGSGIAVTNGNGVAGNISVAQSPRAINQLIDVYQESQSNTKETVSFLNFIGGPNLGVEITPNTSLGGSGITGLDVTISSDAALNNFPNGLTAAWIHLTGEDSGNPAYSLVLGSSGLNVNNNEVAGIQSLNSVAFAGSSPIASGFGWVIQPGAYAPTKTAILGLSQAEVNSGAFGWVPTMLATTAIPTAANSIPFSSTKNGTQGQFDLLPPGSANQILSMNSAGTALTWSTGVPTSGLFAMTPLHAADTPYNASSSQAYIAPYVGNGDPFIINLPATAAKGEQIIVVNFNALDANSVYETRVVPNSAQSISWYANFVTGEGGTQGYASLTGLGESMTFLCLDNDSSQWTVIGAQGGKNALKTV